MGAVVEGPPAVRVAAGLQPRPGAITLGVADHQQQGEQPGVGQAGGLGAEADLPAGRDLQPGPASLAGLAWGISAGLTGGLGLIIFYIGLATGPMSVVAPVSGLVSTILPVAVALAEGERPGCCWPRQAQA